MPGHDQALIASLEHAADVAESSARDQQEAASVARDAARRRRQGSASDEVGSRRAIARVLQLVGGSAERLAGAVGGVRRAWAAAMAAEGLSLRQIGERLGVSHQRVSALLSRHRSGSGQR